MTGNICSNIAISISGKGCIGHSAQDTLKKSDGMSMEMGNKEKALPADRQESLRVCAVFAGGVF
jgi:hypothetical protein